MKALIALVPSLMLGSTLLAGAAVQDTKLYEMRVYYAAPGKLEDLQARFRNHTTKLFEKHGMQNIGYWVPINNPDNKLIYVLAFPDREARDKSFKSFGEDPAWKEVVKSSEANGRLVTKADSIFMKATDFSPAIQPRAASPARVFELRTYKAAPGKLDDLQARFRNHTVKLFEKHGMQQVGYWVPTEAKDGAGDTLLYILAHKDQKACEESFKTFRADPAWVKAKADSEVNGSLTAKDGVQSTLMLPTDYSPMK
jgi:hypothetical protein